MGNPVGVFTNAEVKGLHAKHKARLKKHIVRHIMTSVEIRRIIHANPTLLTSHPRIRKILRKKAGALHKRLKKQKKK
jgi:hypothetical protein